VTHEVKRTLSDWAMLGTLILSIVAHALLIEHRLTLLETKVETLIQLAKGQAR